mgnify:CR=1 FL=1
MRISMSTIDEVRATDAGGSALVAPRVLAMVGGRSLLSDLRVVRPSWTDVSTLDVVDTEELDVFVVDCSAVVSSHGGYRKSGECYDHWARVLSEATLPRFDVLKKQK